jgi:hypothetical protein
MIRWRVLRRLVRMDRRLTSLSAKLTELGLPVEAS